MLVLLAALAAAGVLLARSSLFRHDDRRDTVARYVDAWTRGDRDAMWRLLDRRSRAAHPLRGFAASYRSAYRAAGVTAVTAGPLGLLRGGVVRVPVSVRTREFGTLKETFTIPVHDEDDTARIAWSPGLRLPGLRDDEAVRRRVGRRPHRATIFAADGRRLDSTATGASIAGTPPSPGHAATGLQRIYNDRLGGRRSLQLRFGHRVIARVPGRRGRSVHTTIRLGLQQTALAALGNRVGGVAVVRPRDGAILALAGLAVSAPQPPGSTFKIITLSAALQHRVATPSSSYPVRTFSTLSGVKLRNAGDESCGGSLPTAFAESCNSVFAPLGAKLGARRLVAAAEAFGFNERPVVPAAKPSTISRRLKDSLAVGASAIGQDRDLATPLGMASVGATIANRGVRARPKIVRGAKVVRRRAVSRRVAAQVRDMMIGVVRGGTGTAGAVPGVTVAGKTGTAELRPNSKNPKDADAWFVAFAPAGNPRVALAVMLVGAGFGGTAAAPVARRVLQAAL